MKRISIALAAALVSVVMLGQKPDAAEVELKAAMHKEQVDGDLKGAIAQYQKILNTRGIGRAVAATALLHLGQCHEKLGSAEARKAYERLVMEFADQAEPARAARERLAALSKASEEATPKAKFRQVKMPTRLYSDGSLSPDGKRLAFTAEGSVWVVPVEGKAEPNVTGIPVRLTEPMGAHSAVAWSGNGDWIAFNTRDGIYIVPSAGGTLRKLSPELQRHTGPLPYLLLLSLSPDGSRLAYSSGVSLDSSTVHVAATVGGASRTITSEEGAVMPAFSPDGKRIAFVTLGPDWEERRDQGKLWVVSADGGEPVLISSLQGWPQGPVWSPDGTMIGFLQTPGPLGQAKADVRIVRVSAEGKPVGEPARFELPFPTPSVLAGWTSDNKIGLFAWNQSQEAIYTVPTTGGRAAQVSPKGYAAHPRWSPDGKRIFLRWDGGKIASIPAEGGPVTEVSVDSAVMKYEAVPGGGNAISRDGKTIVFTGASLRDRQWLTNIWTLPVEGGQPTQITHYPSPDTRFPCWSPDGTSIAFVARDNPTEKVEPQTRGTPTFQIYSVPSQGGEAKKLTSVVHRVAFSSPAWSPDGRQIAYFSVDMELCVIPAAGGKPRVVVALSKTRNESSTGPGGLRQFEMAWSPDGKRLAYAFGGRLWTAPLEGGEPSEVSTGLSDVVPTKLDWSPDGKTIAFTGNEGGDYQLWLMEDFLHRVTEAH